MASVDELYVTITIDTEADHDPQWTRSSPLAFDSITRGLPELLQPAFAEVGAVPTYLLTVEVLEDDASVSALRALQGPYEYGTHLHAAFVEPNRKFQDYAGVYSGDFQSSDPPQVERAKLATLSDLFESRLGYRPTSFRAGRYGACANTIDSLESLGYLVDTSVTPHIRWTEGDDVADYRRAPEQPFFPAPGEISVPGSFRPGRLLEVPVTVRPRFMRRNPTWFRPWFSDVEEMKKIVRYQLGRHADRDVLCLNMMFHSMEIIEKASPYPQSSNDVARFIDDMTAALSWCADEGARFVGVSDLHAVYAAREARD